MACRGHSGGGAEGSRQQPRLQTLLHLRILGGVRSRAAWGLVPAELRLPRFVRKETVGIWGLPRAGSPEGCEGALGVGGQQETGCLRAGRRGQ